MIFPQHPALLFYSLLEAVVTPARLMKLSSQLLQQLELLGRDRAFELIAAELSTRIGFLIAAIGATANTMEEVTDRV